MHSRGKHPRLAGLRSTCIGPSGAARGKEARGRREHELMYGRGCSFISGPHPSKHDDDAGDGDDDLDSDLDEMICKRRGARARV